MTKFIKQRKKWRRLVGRRAKVGGGARMQTDRSKKSVPNTHTHIHAQSLDVLKRGKRIKSDDCRREGARANQPPWAYAYKNETKHGKYRTRGTPWFSALSVRRAPWESNEEEVWREGEEGNGRWWSFIENDVGEEGSTLNPILTRLSFHLAGPTFRFEDSWDNRGWESERLETNLSMWRICTF